MNTGIAQGIANLDFVDKALSNMIDNVKGARQILTDARAKPVGAAAAVSFTGSQVYANTTLTVGGQSRTIRGQIVDPVTGPSANANLNNGAYLSNGDVIRVDVRDASNNTTSTRYFRAVAADGALPDQTRAGDTVANAVEFNDLASLANALNLGFGRATASFDAVAGGSGLQLRMAMSSASQSITFGQVTDAAQGGLGTGSSFDFTSLLQNAATNAAAVQIGNSLDTVNAPNASSITYTPRNGTTADQSSIDARRQAADFFRQAMYGLETTVRDANMPGFANILRGETMTIALNDTGSATQSVRVASPLNFFSAPGNSPYGVQLQNSAGTITTAYTDTGTPATDNFMSDVQLTSAINRLNSMTTLLGQQRQLLSAAKTAMSSRLDLNKAMATAMSDAANEMTAADIATETTNLAALQNRQSFAATGLSINRQSEQYLLNLLR